MPLRLAAGLAVLLLLWTPGVAGDEAADGAVDPDAIVAATLAADPAAFDELLVRWAASGVPDVDLRRLLRVIRDEALGGVDRGRLGIHIPRASGPPSWADQGLVDELAHAAPRSLRCDVHVLRLDPARAQALALQPSGPSPPPPGMGEPPDWFAPLAPQAVRRMDHAVAEAILQAARREQGARILGFRSIDLLAGQTGCVATHGASRHLVDYDIVVGMGGSRIDDPIFGTAVEGTEVLVQWKAPSGEDEATIDVEVRWASLRRPVLLLETSLLDHAPSVRIQLPRLRVHGAFGRVVLEDDAWVLAGAFPDPGDDDGDAAGVDVVLVHARGIAPARTATPLPPAVPHAEPSPPSPDGETVPAACD